MMPEITPELIRKHFRCPDCDAEFWNRRMLDVFERSAEESRPWLSYLIDRSPFCAHAAVEYLIARFAVSEKRIEELEAGNARLKGADNA